MGIQDPQVSKRKTGVHVSLLKDTFTPHSSYFSKSRYHENSVREVRETLLWNYNQVLRGHQCFKDTEMHKQYVTPGVWEGEELWSEEAPSEDRRNERSCLLTAGLHRSFPSCREMRLC